MTVVHKLTTFELFRKILNINLNSQLRRHPIVTTYYMVDAHSALLLIVILLYCADDELIMMILLYTQNTGTRVKFPLI